MNFKDIIKNEVLLFDGAMGTQLQQHGVSFDCPEELNLTHPEAVYAVYKSYVDAGSKVIETNTLGANYIKLKKFGLESKTKEVNKNSVEIAKKAASGKSLVALSIGSSGDLLKPFGTLEFDDVFKSYKLQIEGGKDADVLFFETQTDLSEARVGLLSAREVTDTPAVISFTFESNQKTVMGNSPECCAIFAERMNLDALGINCSGGPEELLPILKILKKYCSLPIIVQPNAGLPQLVDGKSEFPFGPETMCEKMLPIVEAGASSIGGCCGTTPEHIRLLKEVVNGKTPPKLSKPDAEYICSRRSFVSLNEAISASYEYKPTPDTSPYDLMDISFSLNGENAVVLDLSELSYEQIKELLIEGQDMPGIPLMFRVKNSDQLESALRYYHGIAAVYFKSVPDAKSITDKYGAYLI